MLLCGKNVHRRVLSMGEDGSETRRDCVTSSQEASMTISRRGKLDMWKGDSAYDDGALEGKRYGERRRIIESDTQTHVSGQTGRQWVQTAPDDDAEMCCGTTPASALSPTLRVVDDGTENSYFKTSVRVEKSTSPLSTSWQGGLICDEENMKEREGMRRLGIPDIVFRAQTNDKHILQRVVPVNEDGAETGSSISLVSKGISASRSTSVEKVDMWRNDSVRGKGATRTTEGTGDRRITQDDLKVILSDKRVHHRVVPVTDDDAEAGSSMASTMSLGTSTSLPERDSRHSDSVCDNAQDGREFRENMGIPNPERWALPSDKTIRRRVVPVVDDDSETVYSMTSAVTVDTTTSLSDANAWRSALVYDDFLDGKWGREHRGVTDRDFRIRKSGKIIRQQVVPVTGDDSETRYSMTSDTSLGTSTPLSERASWRRGLVYDDFLDGKLGKERRAVKNREHPVRMPVKITRHRVVPVVDDDVETGYRTACGATVKTTMSSSKSQKTVTPLQTHPGYKGGRGRAGRDLWARISGKNVRQQVVPVADDDAETECSITSATSIGTSTPLSTLPRNVDVWQGGLLYHQYASDGRGNRAHERGSLIVPNKQHDILDPIVECRDMSASAWLHFPSVELVFLFFAFEGFIAAQVSGVRQTGWLAGSITSAVVLVLFPVLMIAGVCRTMLVRVYSNVVVEFRRLANVDTQGRGLISRSTNELRNGGSLFGWADKGRWHTVPTSDEGLRRERNWFRIGFEPLFVTFTHSAAWFTVVFLVEWASLACIAVLVESDIVRLFLFCGIHFGMFVMLVLVRPFANKVLDCMASIVAFINAASMASMAANTLSGKSSQGAQGIQSTVNVLQILVLCALSLPIYIDAVATVMIAISRAIAYARRITRPNTNEAPQRSVRGFTMRAWTNMWCRMLCRNMAVYVKDVQQGIRRPRVVQRRQRPQTYLNPASLAVAVLPRPPTAARIGAANSSNNLMNPRARTQEA